jgi:3-oxoadipate enol-lactonase
MAPSAASDSRTLVLVHAFPMGARMWDAQRAALSGWRVLTPSLPGFDGHPLEGERTMAGYVLFELLRQASARVSGLILADTRTSIDTPDRLAARERSIVRARRQGSAAIADEMLPSLLGATTHGERPQVVAQVRALIESQPPETIVAGLQAIMTRPDSAAVLASIAVPTLFIVGDEDVITPPSDALAMHRAVPGSTLVTISGAGHMSNLEDPEAFNAAIHRLLDTCGEQASHR